MVDGSNLATEGRTSPSLRQLDEAVKAYAEEDPDAEFVVVVDASFGHRIDSAERSQFEQAELHGELVSPPAGAIGRGDAFVLRIAERTGATVLSNDSFQEFHAEHPWLFDVGRLVGGKPVPGVGWIFSPRTPVRGPRSRQVTGKAKRGTTGPRSSRPRSRRPRARAAKKVAARRAAARADGTSPKIGDVREAGGTAQPPKAKKAAAPKMAEPAPVPAPKAASKRGSAKKGAKDGGAEHVAEPPKPAKTVKAAKKEKPAKAAAAEATKAKKAAEPTKATRAKKAAEPAKATRAEEGCRAR